MILRNLLYNEEFVRKVLPFIRPEYFQDQSQKIIFQEISSFVEEFNNIPSKEVLNIEVEKRNDVNEDQYREVCQTIEHLTDVPVDFSWLVETSEKWCRDRAIYLALMESVQLADGGGEKSPDSIPSILQEALAVSFDNHVGHDYLNDSERDMIHTTKRRIKLNSISNISTKSRKVVYLTRLLTSRLLVQVSASLYSCATWR